MNTTMKTLSSMLFFTTAGFVAGMLFAPDKGTKTRRKLKKDANRKINDLEKLSHSTMEEGKAIYKKNLKKVLDAGDQVLSNAKEAVPVK